jgi:hypothetical protein
METADNAGVGARAQVAQTTVQSTGAATAVSAQVVHVHKWLIAISVMLGTVMEMIDTSIVNVALPHMQGTFSATVDEIAWVATSYLLANGIMIPMTAWISSRFGRKRYFMFSVAMFTSASMLCGMATSLNQIVLFRLLQGAAGAAMQPSSQAILMETFPPEEQQMAMAMWGVGMMVAPIAGPTLGGWITDNWAFTPRMKWFSSPEVFSPVKISVGEHGDGVHIGAARSMASMNDQLATLLKPTQTKLHVTGCHSGFLTDCSDARESMASGVVRAIRDCQEHQQVTTAAL